MNSFLKIQDLFGLIQSDLEFSELLTFFSLDVERNLDDLVNESSNLTHILFHVTSCGDSWCSNSDTAWSDCTLVTDDGVLIESNVHAVTGCLQLGSSKSLINAAHENDVVVCTISDQFVASLHELFSQYLGVDFHLCDVVSEFLGGSLFELSCKSTNLVIMWPTLKHWKHSKVNGISYVHF
jgi:hypothetical protein